MITHPVAPGLANLLMPHPRYLLGRQKSGSSPGGMGAAGIKRCIIKAKPQKETTETNRIDLDHWNLQYWIIKAVNWTLRKGEWAKKNVKKENKNRTQAFILYFVLVIFFRPRWRFVSQTEISGKYNSPFDFCFLSVLVFFFLSLFLPQGSSLLFYLICYYSDTHADVTYWY